MVYVNMYGGVVDCKCALDRVFASVLCMCVAGVCDVDWCRAGVSMLCLSHMNWASACYQVVRAYCGVCMFAG